MTEERDPVAVRGCSVNGCLIAAVTIFIVLLIGLLIIGYFRFSEPPASTEHVVVSNVK